MNNEQCKKKSIEGLESVLTNILEKSKDPSFEKDIQYVDLYFNTQDFTPWKKVKNQTRVWKFIVITRDKKIHFLLSVPQVDPTLEEIDLRFPTEATLRMGSKFICEIDHITSNDVYGFTKVSDMSSMIWSHMRHREQLVESMSMSEEVA